MQNFHETEIASLAPSKTSCKNTPHLDIVRGHFSNTLPSKSWQIGGSLVDGEGTYPPKCGRMRCRTQTAGSSPVSTHPECVAATNTLITACCEEAVDNIVTHTTIL
ncbi:hypothetical protein B0H34DRAFT_287056 [Crassisporium funariophilum]|nr:hypothetical protein B0H34DRAFT_287056 [Crassisporium funariophilum]